jgi:type I pantothenate kinase
MPRVTFLPAEPVPSSPTPRGRGRPSAVDDRLQRAGHYRPQGVETGLSPYITFDREGWAALRAATPLTLSEDDVADLQGINEQLSLDEVVEVYLPLSRLLNLYVAAAQQLHQVTDTFLGQPAAKVPYVIGIAGSVAVGKSTTARILQALLSRWPNHPTVDLVTTDGFLFPNAELEARGLMSRKGFPESYDVRRLVQFVGDVKAGMAEVRAPIYSHEVYDITDEELVVRSPDVLIVEGLNVLQTPEPGRSSRLFVSDFFDFSIYVDADEADILQWYVERFMTLRDTIFRNERSFFRMYAELSEPDAIETARSIWSGINGPNLTDNILPTRERATLVLHKGGDHRVTEVRLRKL